jgi:hypothetical protein
MLVLSRIFVRARVQAQGSESFPFPEPAHTSNRTRRWAI